MRRHLGFTLMELLVVLALIAILATLAAPMVSNSLLRAKETTLKENLFILRKAIDDFYADAGSYPGELKQLVEKRYIRKVPVDPLTERDDTWVLMRAEEEKGEGGIIDVRSGSEEKTSNGESYREW